MQDAVGRLLVSGSGIRGRYLPAVLWTLLILTLNSIPGDEYPRVRFPHADKLVHAMMYFPVGLLYARAVLLGQGSRGTIVAAIFAGAAMGALDELHQIWIPHRGCSLADWVVDCVSVAGGALVAKAAFKRFCNSKLPV